MPTRAVAALSALVLSLLMCGCASLPSVVERPVATSIAAPADAPLPALARELAIPPGQSALRSIPMPHHALAARLELIARAQSSLDLQTYHIADDATGRLLLRALRDAAERGVRVRLLVDDFHTEGLDELLLGLAAHPGAEVRLFNPFAYGRDASPVRLWQFLTDFGRLNHRMHNKLFVADGVFAIAGGRNLADDYFLRSARSNFIDFDLLAAGALVPELSRPFDAYWNSERVYPLQAVAGNHLDAAQRRARFEQRTAGDTRGSVPGLSEVAAGNALRPRPDPSDEGLFGFFIAPAGAFADAPVKLRNDSYEPGADSVTGRLIRLLATEAKSEVILARPTSCPDASAWRICGSCVRAVSTCASSPTPPASATSRWSAPATSPTGSRCCAWGCGYSRSPRGASSAMPACAACSAARPAGCMPSSASSTGRSCWPAP